MKDKDKTKEQPMNELEEMRQRVAEAEASVDRHRQAEEEANRLLKTIETAREAIFITAADGAITYANEATNELFGYKSGELIGKYPSVFNAGPAPELVMQNIMGTIEKEEYWEGEVHNKRKDGTEFTSYARVSALRDKDGKIINFLSTQHDTTERRELGEELRKFKTVSDKAGYGVAMSDLEGNLSYVNDAFAQMHGYAPDELIGKHLSVFHNEEQMGNVNRLAERLRQTGTYVAEEVWHKRKDNSVFPTLMNGTLVKDENEIPLFMAATAMDMTDRKQAEDSRRESEGIYRTLFDVSADGIVIADASTREFVYVNPALCKMLGYDERELTGMHVEDVHPQDSLQRVFSEFEAQAKGQKTLAEDIPCLRKDGSVVYADINTATTSIAGRQCNMGIFRDITERKKVEREIWKQKEDLQTIIDSSHASILYKDTENRILRANRVAAERMNLSVKDLEGKTAHELFPEHADKYYQDDLKVLGSGKPEFGIVEEIVMPSGERRWVSTDKVPYNDEQGNIAGLIAFVTDITGRRQIEEQLRHSQLLASLGEMTAGLAHEVGNPLASILLMSELVMQSDIPPQARKDLRAIRNEAKRAGKIMRDLLIYSRKVMPHIRRLNLNSLLDKVLDMRRYAETVRNISVSINMLKGPLYIRGDPSQLTQVFVNVILNAEEALRESNGGNIVVTTEIDGEWAKVSIADDGNGIPEENLNLVFHPFFSTKKVGEGTGLGLSTCYGIVTGHGGSIHAENNEMGGATFTVQIPLA